MPSRNVQWQDFPPVVHHSVEEIWYVIGGEGEIWRKLDEEEQVVE